MRTMKHVECVIFLLSQINKNLIKSNIKIESEHNNRNKQCINKLDSNYTKSKNKNKDL